MWPCVGSLSAVPLTLTHAFPSFSLACLCNSHMLTLVSLGIFPEFYPEGALSSQAWPPRPSKLRAMLTSPRLEPRRPLQRQQTPPPSARSEATAQWLPLSPGHLGLTGPTGLGMCPCQLPASWGCRRYPGPVGAWALTAPTHGVSSWGHVIL